METVSVDGECEDGTDNEAWATKRDGTGTICEPSAANAPLRIKGGTSSNWAKMGRIVMGFDTSAIGAGGTVNSGNIMVQISAVQNNYSQSVVIDRNPPATATDLVNGDYDIGGWDGVDQGTATIAVSSLDLTNYNVFTLSVAARANVSVTGVTWMGASLSGDFNNSEPSVGANVSGGPDNFQMADTAGTTEDPVLTVDYTAAIAATYLPQIIIMWNNLKDSLFQRVYAHSFL